MNLKQNSNNKKRPSSGSPPKKLTNQSSNIYIEAKFALFIVDNHTSLLLP